jgi:hypothetical protein
VLAAVIYFFLLVTVLEVYNRHVCVSNFQVRMKRILGLDSDVNFSFSNVKNLLITAFALHSRVMSEGLVSCLPE